MKNYFSILDKAIKEYEDFKPYKTLEPYQITDKIVWCYKWKKITKEQMENLTNRMTFVFNNIL